VVLTHQSLLEANAGSMMSSCCLPFCHADLLTTGVPAAPAAQYIAAPAMLQLPYAPPVPPEAQTMSWGVPVAGAGMHPPPPPAVAPPPSAYSMPEPTKPRKGEDEDEKYPLI
jgi:hypothetical protein